MSAEDPLSETLDGIYRSYLRVKPRVDGRPDKEVRDPSIILDIARELRILSVTGRVMKVTGSKGKGTTARLAALMIEQQMGQEVGLFASPEEDRAPDRMQIGGKPPKDAVFRELYERLKPHLDAAEARLEGDQYLSPFGIFFLMALQWFKDEGVTWMVLECGRGALYDEVGRMEAQVGVVTSIFEEHLEQLGPTLADIAANKLAIGDTVERLVVSRQVEPFLGGRHARLPLAEEEYLAVPNWVRRCHTLAKTAAIHLLDQGVHPVATEHIFLPSYGTLPLGHTKVVWEACINEASLDRGFVERLIEDSDGCLALASLPDDKDREPLLAALQDLGLPVKEIALSGERGRLSYAKAEAVFATLDYRDAAGLLRVLKELAEAQPHGTLYVIGTQTFIRLVRAALTGSAF